MHPFVLGLSHVGLDKHPHSENEDQELLKEAISSGVVAFDTSNSYGNGGSERLLGQVIKDNRERFHISTKAGYRSNAWAYFMQYHDPALNVSRQDLLNRGIDQQVSTYDLHERLSKMPYSEGLLPGQDFSAEAIKDSLMSSLARLGTEFVDTFMLHSPPVNIDAELVDCMSYLYEWDLCKRIGVSCRIFADAYHFLRQPWVQVVQIPFVSDYAAMTEVCSLAEKSGAKVMVRELMQRSGYGEWLSPQSALLLSLGLSFTMTDLIRDIFLFPAVQSVVIRTGNIQHLAENMLAAMYAQAKRGRNQVVLASEAQ